MTDLVVCIITSYIITVIIVANPHLEGVRRKIREKTLWIKTKPHFIDCRLCIGFWVSFIVCVIYGNYHIILPVYGASYFIATQERR